MINQATMIIYRFLDVFKHNFHPGEIFLNILFISLIIIICMIIYWDTINSRVAQTSRCKRQMDLYNKNKGIYTIKANDKMRNPLYNITYDTHQYNTDVECSCKGGKYVNYFNNIPVKNLRTNKDVKVDKICSCDKYYNVSILNENIVYDGEPGLLRYMNANNSDFFDNLVYATYS